MNKLKQTRLWVPLIVAIAVALGVFVGKNLNSAGGLTDKEEKLTTILDIINHDYVDIINTDSLLELVFPTIVGNLDPHSSYISAEDLQSFNEGIEGSFSGIGISFNMLNDTVNVIEVIGGGPSQRAGLQAGDRIIKIDGEEVVGQGLSAEKIRSRLKGVKGSHVMVEVKRATADKLLTFDIERGDVPVNSIDAFYIIEPGVGYVNVNQFSRTTYDEFINALGVLSMQGAESFIVDLRGNPGGYLEMAILMANEFLPKGAPIVYTRTRDGRDDQAVMSDGRGSFQNAQLVVLLDEFSASSSEVFSGAIQDNDRGVIMGRRSFGKGLIQRQMMLPDSSALQLTIGRYYTPSGRSIQKDYSNQQSYKNDIVDRFSHGEAYTADSIRQDTTNVHHTLNGRTVYGGGGIMPDIFVPSDTSGVTGYFLNVSNAGLLNRFAFDYVDANRSTLNEAQSVDELLQMLPQDDVLLRRFVNFASASGIPARWYYINISANLIVNQLKAFIARAVLGSGAGYEILNTTDNTVQKALQTIRNNEALSPVGIQGSQN